MKKADTYAPYFDSAIDTLADILAKRDDAQNSFEESGGEVMIEYTNKAGATNMTQHPMLRLINDYNRDALAYWRDLGLTPAGLKRINEEAMKKKPEESALTKALSKLSNA